MRGTTRQSRGMAWVDEVSPFGTPIADRAGVSPTEVLIGQTVGLTGPVGAVAREVVLGTQALLQSVNDAGGIHGRRLCLLTLDDAHEPSRIVHNLHHLARVDTVFALANLTGVVNCPVGAPLMEVWSTPCVGWMVGAPADSRQLVWQVLTAHARRSVHPPVQAWQLWLSYQVAMRRLGAMRLSAASLEAYLHARLLSDAMRLCGPDLCRSRLVAVVRGLAESVACGLPVGTGARAQPQLLSHKRAGASEL